MIEGNPEGVDDLAEVLRFGNPWHGWVTPKTGGGYQVTIDLDDHVQDITPESFYAGGGWLLEHPTISAPTTPAEDQALHMEWRNAAVIPMGAMVGYADISAGGILFDDSGDPWHLLFELASSTTTAKARPFGQLDADGIVAQTTLTVTSAALPSGTITQFMRIMDRDSTGQKVLFGYYTDGTYLTLNSIVEAEISGSGTSQEIAYTVKKTPAECAFTTNIISNTQNTSTCAVHYEQDQLWHAWYKPAGGIEYLTLHAEQEANGSVTCSDDDPLTHVHEEVNVVTTYRVSIVGDGRSIAASEYEMDNTVVADAYEDGTGYYDVSTTYSVGGTQVADYSHRTEYTDSANPFACGGTVVTAPFSMPGSMPCWQLFLAYDYAEVYDFDTSTTTSLVPDPKQGVFVFQQPILYGPHLIAMVACGSESIVIDPMPTLPNVEFDNVSISEFIHPAGEETGGAAGPAIVSLTSGKYIVTSVNGGYGAYNPYTQTALVMQAKPTGVI